MRTTKYIAISYKFLAALVIIAMLVLVLPVAPALAASTITVTTTTDEFTGTGNLCSLREAIALANNPDPNVLSQNDCTRPPSVDPADTIVLQSGSTYTLTRAGAGGTSVGDLDIGDSSGLSGNLTIEASGSTPAVIDGNDIDRVLDVDAVGNHSLTLTYITVTNGNTTGQATTSGGGISFAGTGTLTLTNSTVSDNVSASPAGCGGGIFNNSAATVVITNSTISGNSCPTTGSDGGGIFKGSGGTLTITNSTITNNITAENGGGVHIGASGATSVAITNSTFASNTAGNRGGGLQVGGTLAVVTVDFSTFSYNIANEVSMTTPGVDGGGALQVSLGSVTVTRSILANSIVTNGVPGTPKDCHKAGTGSPIASITDSIIENNSLGANSCTGSFTTGDPSLGALASNGGPTQTISIPSTSLAYDTADSCGAVTTDQRGFTRPQSVACDLGAFELQDPNLPTVSSIARASSNPTNASSVDYTVTFSEDVFNVDAADFSLVQGGSVTGASVGIVSGSGTTRTVPVNTGTGDGTLQLNIAASPTIQDLDGNPLSGGFTSGEIYTVDKTAPTVSITRSDYPTMGTSTVDFGIAFSEAVTGVNTSDFQLTPGGSVTGASISGSVSGLGATYSLTANTGTGDGTLRLDVKAAATISDLAGNAFVGPYTGGEVYTILKSAAVVDVNIAGINQATYQIPLQGSKRDTYSVDNGPMQIVSTSGIPVIAALRDIWLVNGQGTSFAQLMGLPEEQLSDTYYLPAYNNVTLSGQLRFGNVDTFATDVTVKIGGIDRGTYHLNPNQSTRQTYNLDTGPVEVKSSNGAKIIVALRDIWLVNGQGTSFTQLMGLPKEQLSDTYYLPAYNNVTLSGQLRFGNVDTIATDVTVKIGGVDRGTYHLNPNESTRQVYNLDTGPVEVKSSNGANIIVALRDAWLVNGQATSFAQLMGVPKESLSDTYYLPAYNNVTLSGQLRFGNVDTIATDVTVKIGGATQGTYTLNPNESTRQVYPLDTGPVEVKSSNGANIIVALRDAWLVNGQATSFAQLMGLPKELLSDTYYLPAYNNVTLSGQLRFGMP